MTVSARAVPIAEPIEQPVDGWTPTDPHHSVAWPPKREVSVRAAWLAEGVPVAFIEDERIMRAYLVADGADGRLLMSDLVAKGVVVDPATLVATARHASGWGALGDSLYDLIAGCGDIRSDEAVDVWLRRATDDHPLIRLAAAWTGPYLPVDRVRDRIADIASGDDDPQVRSAAQESMAALELMD